MATIKLTKNELKSQKDSLKMYNRYLPTLQLKKQQLQTEIRSIDARAREVRQMRKNLEAEFAAWIAVFGEDEAFKPGSPKSRKRKDNYGFGWRIPSKYPGCYYHYGWWKAYRSFFIRDDVNDKTIIILTNTNKGPNSDHFWKIINDKTNPIPPASVNITYWESKIGSRFPYSSYRERIVSE